MKNVKNSELYEALQEYCKMALALLQKRSKEPSNLPKTIKEELEITDSEAVGQYVPEVEWGALIGMNLDGIQQIDAYRAALQAIRADEKVARHLKTLVGTPWSQGIVTEDMVLQSLLGRILNEQQDTGFQEPTFNRIYAEIEDYFYRDVLEYRYLSPLHNFDMEATRIELGPKFSITRISERQKQQMFSLSSL